MNKQTRILGISGSLRRESYNTAALRAAVSLAPEGVTIETFELHGIPSFNQDEEGNPPEKIVELKKRVREADAILFVTPEYNYSVPGVLKNAIDWASRPAMRSPFAGKPVLMLAATTGRGGAKRALNHLRQVLESMDASPLSTEVSVARARDRFTDGAPDAELRGELRAALSELPIRTPEPAAIR